MITRGAAFWRDGGVLIVIAASLLAIWSSLDTVITGPSQPAVAIAFVLLIACGETIRLRLPDERVQAPIGFAGALGYALITALPGGVPVHHGVPQTIAVTTLGMLIGALPHVIAGRPAEVVGMARRVLVVASIAAIFRPLVLSSSVGDWLHDYPTINVLVTACAVLLGWPLEALGVAAVDAGRRVGPFRPLFRDVLLSYPGIGAAIASTGALVALSSREIGLWALPLLSAPLLLAQLAFRRYAGIRRTQGQTIRALSRTTDVGGYTEPGHAWRVADLALAVGRDVGLPEKRLRLLQYGALMHDLGQLSLSDPIPGGSTVLLAPDERRRLAERSAEVIRQTGVPDEVAAIVEAQAEPYRRPHVPDDTEVATESRIIKVVNAYDDLVGSSQAENARLEALETLRLGMAYEYDPRVVASLVRVLERTALRA